MDVKIIIFTDLDGTLLDHHTYSHHDADEALSQVNKRKASLVLCSSKTKEEIEVYRKRLSNRDPFILENGGAIYIPKECKDLAGKFDHEDSDYFTIIIGTEYGKLVDAFDKIKRRTGVNAKGINEFTLDEVVQLTSLQKEEAVLAMKREYTLPFVVPGGAEEGEAIQKEILLSGFNFTEGANFKYLMGANDKGKAVRILVDIFKRNYPEEDIITVGIGDSLNDLPMLEAVDRPFLVKKVSGDYDDRIRVKNLGYADGIGPVGWNKVVLRLFNKKGFV
ncbi:MAG: HAD-IIB family hydrolase [Candidatus Scalindua sp. AMX11]|nr:MAG: HAD-IIB family hydrolase [Candidatus Scalindua sp.]NOG85840.1 HAD-IIB family hydrolase [Planctomycetota bacterium]RZV96988.1 MAG: HAD-IIB family hydrolase [Candidatus Scalindua sp. SCAELEC01]TDE66400.1 MAG: HAD-IIB family hydrolase [Candidatus Scalindua sp. AMX11]GJQ58209.1 MAG: mannosyl-3-phosphoglycerate phosphatase [Candidatus Scalindua sp.]